MYTYIITYISCIHILIYSIIYLLYIIYSTHEFVLLKRHGFVIARCASPTEGAAADRSRAFRQAKV